MPFLGVLIFSCFFVAAVFSLPTNQLICTEGTMLNLGRDGQPDSCVPCENGYFNSETHHRQEHCKQCTPFEEMDPYLVLVESCTKTHDTVIRCAEGFFFDASDMADPCVICSDCSRQGMFEVQACVWNSNTICCPEEGMVIVDNACAIPK